MSADEFEFWFSEEPDRNYPRALSNRALPNLFLKWESTNGKPILKARYLTLLET